MEHEKLTVNSFFLQSSHEVSLNWLSQKKK